MRTSPRPSNPSSVRTRTKERFLHAVPITSILTSTIFMHHLLYFFTLPGVKEFLTGNCSMCVRCGLGSRRLPSPHLTHIDNIYLNLTSVSPVCLTILQTLIYK